MDEKRMNEKRSAIGAKLNSFPLTKTDSKTKPEANKGNDRKKPEREKKASRSSIRNAGAVGEGLNYATREAFKRLRTNLLLALGEDMEAGCCVIGVTSAQPSEGKSTISINAAYSLAELGKKVLLIDADMRKPSVHSKLNMSSDFGLSELLGGANSIRDAIQTYGNADGSTSFDVITGGRIPRNPSELLNSDRMKKLMDALLQAYDIILLDLPPVGAVIDAVSAGSHTNGMIVVLRESNCPIPVFDDCIHQLKYAGIRILGFVVNGAMEGAGKSYQYKYKY